MSDITPADERIRELEAELERYRKGLLFISQQTALSGETCRLVAQDILGGFVERGESSG